jgi:hypothetical protein
MDTNTRKLKASLCMAVLLIGIAAGARGQVGDGGQAFGVSGTGAIQLRGQVVCTNCYLDEVKRTPFTYQLTHKHGRLVMNVTWTSNTSRWNRIVWPPQLHVRGEERLIQQLGAEENLMKELEVSGVLGNSRTFDLSEVSVRG